MIPDVRCLDYGSLVRSMRLTLHVAFEVVKVDDLLIPCNYVPILIAPILPLLHLLIKKLSGDSQYRRHFVLKELN
jgi:hypothetical protein